MTSPPLPCAWLEQLKHVSSFNQDQFYDMKVSLVYCNLIKTELVKGTAEKDKECISSPLRVIFAFNTLIWKL